MNGGGSDDGFEYFQGWLIAHGRSVFEAALLDPDSLADIVPEDAEADFEFENADILNVAERIWETKTDSDAAAFYKQVRPYQNRNHFGDLELWSSGGDADPEKCRVLYPKLWEKFGWSADTTNLPSIV